MKIALSLYLCISISYTLNSIYIYISIYLYKSLLVIVMGRVGNQNGSGGHTFCYGQKGSCYWGSFCSVRKPG